MLFTGREVRIGKNCARGLEYGPRPQAESRTRCPITSFQIEIPVILWVGQKNFGTMITFLNQVRKPLFATLQTRIGKPAGTRIISQWLVGLLLRQNKIREAILSPVALLQAIARCSLLGPVSSDQLFKQGLTSV